MWMQRKQIEKWLAMGWLKSREIFSEGNGLVDRLHILPNFLELCTWDTSRETLTAFLILFWGAEFQEAHDFYSSLVYTHCTGPRKLNSLYL